MKKKQYDIIVIGAGPGGSICARDLARSGYNVLLAEKRPVVGVPVRCGEATGARARLADFVSINEDYIETDIHGLILHTNANRIQYDAKDIGLMLDRTIFDADLARQAEAAGAELCLNARVSNVRPASHGERKISIIYEGEEVEVGAKMIAAADGVESLCGRWTGLKSRQLAPKICSAIEFVLEGKDAYPNHLSFWIGWPGIKKGYVWVFPKVKSNTLNVGAGTITPQAKEPNMQEVTAAFVEKFYPGYKLLKIHGGAVPVSGVLEEYTAERFLLLGDAAHHTNPLTGGGIASAMYAGEIAAQWIDGAFKSLDFSSRYFKQYEKDVWEKFGKSHHQQIRIRDFMFGLKGKDQEKFFETVKNMVDAEFSFGSKIFGLAGIGRLILKNWGLSKKIWKTTRPPVY